MIIGLFFIAVCVFLVPRYYAVNKAREAMSAGGSAMGGGDFALGAARMRYALEQFKLANGGTDTATLNSVRADVAAAAVANPLESLPGLALLADYKIGLTCEQKQAVAMPLLRGAGGALKNSNAANAGAALYSAALWLQGCAFDGQKQAQYNTMLDSYAALDSAAGTGAWLDRARSGQTVDAAYAPPVLKPADLEKLENVDIKTRAAEFAGSMKYSMTRIASAGAALRMPEMPGAKSKQGANKKQAPPAKSAPMVQTVDTTQTATGTEQPPAADAGEKKPEKAPAPEKKPEAEEKPAPAESKPAPAAKKPADSGRQGKLVSDMPPPARGMSVQQACAAIRDTVAAKGVTVSSVSMPGSGNVVLARIRTGSVKAALLNEVTAVLSAAYQYAGTGETGHAADHVTIHVEDARGNKRYTFGVNMDSYARYSTGALDRKTFLEKHMTVE